MTLNDTKKNDTTLKLFDETILLCVKEAKFYASREFYFLEIQDNFVFVTQQ